MATVLVHIALLAYAAAAATYLGWLVKPRDRLVSLGRGLLLIGLVLHVASFVLATAVFAATVARGDRRADEARIVAYAKAHANEATALLERLVNVNSGTMNPEGVREIGRILAGELEATGFSTRWIDLPEAGGKEPDHPAPVLTLAAAATGGDTHGGSTGSSGDTHDEAATTGHTATWPGITGLVAGVLALLLAIVALVRTRRPEAPATAPTPAAEATPAESTK